MRSCLPRIKLKNFTEIFTKKRSFNSNICEIKKIGVKKRKYLKFS